MNKNLELEIKAVLTRNGYFFVLSHPELKQVSVDADEHSLTIQLELNEQVCSRRLNFDELIRPGSLLTVKNNDCVLIAVEKV